MKANKRRFSKKSSVFILMLAMILIGLSVLAGCNNLILSNFKIAGKQVIENYANERRNSYTEDNWTVVCDIVENGKKSVDAATDEAEIDSVVVIAKNAIDEVLQDGLGIGAFYNLQEAFDNGWLQKEDLQSIASYIGDDFKSTYPKTLNAGVESIIKETRAYDLRSDVDANGDSRCPDAKSEDVSIIGYYGEYNNVFAVMINDSFTSYHEALWSETISSVTFNYANGNRILIWKEEKRRGEQMRKTFYTLQEASADGLLTIENLQCIANHHNNGTSATDELDVEIVKSIKEVAALSMSENAPYLEEVQANDFSIIKYYGTYGRCVAIMVNDPYHSYPAEDLDINESIKGVIFHYTNPNRIVVWKK